MKKTIAQQLKIADFPFEIRDKRGNLIYYERSDNFWQKWTYDLDNNEQYYEQSNGYSYKCEYNSIGLIVRYEDSNNYWKIYEYDSDGNQIYCETSKGIIIDDRPKESTKRCFCGAKFDGIQCYACGFDATEIDIY